MTHSTLDRLEDLLAERATQGLDLDEANELGQLLERHPEVDPDAYDRAASALCVALQRPAVEPLPVHLRAKLVGGAELCAPTVRASRPAAAPRPLAQARNAAGPNPALTWTGWLLAAASLLLVLVLSTDRDGPLRAKLDVDAVAALPDAVQVPWSSTGDPLGERVEGTVVWSDAQQQGFMRFRNLSANDPTANQYQLWIFDATRPSEHPVDGGVFDVPAGAEEVVVPIDPKLSIDSATLFAITLERPGGVVVSSRERLLLTAAVE